MAFDPEHQIGFVATAKSPQKRIKLSFDTRILLMTLLISLPGAIVAELFLWLGDRAMSQGPVERATFYAVGLASGIALAAIGVRLLNREAIVMRL